MKKLIVQGAPVRISETTANTYFDIGGCGRDVAGIATLRLERVGSPGDWVAFTTDQRDGDGRLRFEWPPDAWKDRAGGRYMGTLTVGGCCLHVQIELAGCGLKLLGAISEGTKNDVCL